MKYSVVFFLVFFIGINAGFGQSAFNPDSALQNILDKLEGTSLPLQTALQYALENATSVKTAEASFLAAQGADRRESGAFDPELFFSLNYFDQKQPSASFFAGAQVLATVQTNSSAGLRWKSPLGTRLEASLSSVRLNSNSSFAFLNPQYTTVGTLSLRQPLLGGFHVSARKMVVKSEEELNAAKARYDQEVLATSTQAEKSYWALYAAERDYAVQKLTRDRGEAFLRETELRAKAGLVGPNQVANARTFLAEQEIFLLEREEQLDRFSDQLATFIGVRPEGNQHRFITVDNPREDFPLQDINVLINQAIQNNLGIKAAESDVEAKRALASAAWWEALPSVNLVGSLGGNGLSGTPQDVIFGSDTLRTTVNGDFSDAVSQAVERKFPSWSVGVEVSIPLGFRSGFGEKDRLNAEVVIAEQRYIQQKRMLEDQVRSTYNELAHGRARLSAARAGVEAAQEQVRIGIIEFQNGRTTAFELVRLGADFAVAQQRYTQALIRSANAAVDLQLLTSGSYSSAK